MNELRPSGSCTSWEGAAEIKHQVQQQLALTQVFTEPLQRQWKAEVVSEEIVK